MTTNIWLGTSLANFKVVSVSAGVNVTALVPPPTFTIGLGTVLFTFTGWSPSAIVTAWNASSSSLIQDITASVSGNAVIFTANNAGQDFEISCSLVNSVINQSSTYQTLSLSPEPSGGTFTLTVAGSTTGAITFSATPATFVSNMQAAINALGGFGTSDVVVSYVSATGLYWFDFSQGRFAGTSVAIMTATHTSLTGGNASIGIVETQAGNAGTSQIDSLSFPVAGSHSATVNEVQTLSTLATDGTFSLTLSGYGTTVALPFSAGRSAIKAALETVVGVENVDVSGGPLFWPATATYYPITITFQGTLAGINLPQLIVNVLTGGVDEQQQLVMTGSPTSGTFTLTFGGQTTAALPYTATASALATALTGLSSIGAGNLVATGGPLTQVTTVPGANEVQQLTSTFAATGGTFTLSFGGHTTSSLSLQATAATIQTAIVALSSIGTGNAACSGGPLVVQNGPFGGANEQQQLSLSGMPATSSSLITGTYTLTYGGQTTGTLNLTDSNTTVQTAIQALSSVGSGNFQVGGGPLLVTSGPTGGANEIQQISKLPSGGDNFTLSFGGQTTSGLGNGFTDAQVQTALQALSSIGSGNVLVQFQGSPGSNDLIFCPFNVTFQGALAGASQALITVNQTSGFGAPTISRLQAGSAGTYSYSTNTLSLQFIGSLGLASHPLITITGPSMSGSSGETLTNVETVAGSAQFFTYTNNPINVTFQGSLALTPEALITSAGTNPVTVTEITLGHATTSTYAYFPVIATFQGSKADTAEALITSTTVTGGTVVISELVAGGNPPYPVATLQNGGTTAVQNISGGTFSLSILGTVVTAPYNVTAIVLASLINSAFGTTVCTCTGGPAPNSAITITFTGSLGLRPVVVTFQSALVTNLVGSVTQTTVSTGSSDPLGLNVWDMVVCPGNGTLGVLSNTSSQVWITITNNLTALTSALFEAPVGQIYLPLATISAEIIEAAINEALAFDACRVTQVGKSQEWANVEVPAGGGGTSGFPSTPNQWTSFWYIKDTYRITFINQFAASGSVSLSASFALIGSPGEPATPSVFMGGTNSGIIQDPADTLDFFPEVNRVVVGFNLMQAAGTPLHQCSASQSTVVPASQLGWRFKLQTKYNAGNVSHVGLADYPSSGSIQFTWNKKTVSDLGVITLAPLVSSAIIDWNSQASVVQTVLANMLFGVGNVTVTGGLSNSWLSESLLDAPVNSYRDLKVLLTGQLKGLPLDEFEYDLSCAIVVQQFDASTSFQKDFRIVQNRYTRTLPPHQNTRQKVSIASPGSVAVLSLGVNNLSVVVPPSSTAAQVQTLLDGLYGSFPTLLQSAVNGTPLFPTKLAHPIFVYGTTFADGPMEFEFSSLGLQSSPQNLIVSSQPTGVTIGLITTVTQGVNAQDELQTVSVLGQPFGGTFALSWGGNTTSSIAYNSSLATLTSALAAASPSAIVATSVTGSTGGPWTFDWAATGGHRALITSTSSLNNAATAIVIANIGGASATFSVTEVTKGRGPWYADDFNNWSLGRTLNSGDTAVFDDSPAPMLYGLNLSSVFSVISIGAGTAVFIHTRKRQVFDNGQTVKLLVTGTAPTGLTAGTVYTVINAQPDGTFSLSLSGTPIVASTVGSGTFTLAVSSLTVTVNNQFGGAEIGLAHLRDGLELEYLSCYLKALFSAITLGIGGGNGLGLGRFDTMTGATIIEINSTGSTSLAPVPAVLFLGNNSSTTFDIQSGDVGIAYYAEETSVVGTINIVTGTLTVNNSTTGAITKGTGASFKSNNTLSSSTIELS